MPEEKTKWVPCSQDAAQTATQSEPTRRLPIPPNRTRAAFPVSTREKPTARCHLFRNFDGMT